MHKQDQFDQPVERPTYNSAQFSEWHQRGLLTRPEAEVLDIIYTRSAQVEEEGPVAPAQGEAPPSSRSYIAIIHEDVVIPVLDLERLLQQPKTRGERMSICAWVAGSIIDLLLALFEEAQGS